MVISKKPLTETKVLFKNSTIQPSAFIMTAAAHSVENGLYNFLLISTQGEGPQLPQHLHPDCSLEAACPHSTCCWVGSPRTVTAVLLSCLPCLGELRLQTSPWSSLPLVFLQLLWSVSCQSYCNLKKSQAHLCDQRTQKAPLSQASLATSS